MPQFEINSEVSNFPRLPAGPLSQISPSSEKTVSETARPSQGGGGGEVGRVTEFTTLKLYSSIENNSQTARKQKWKTPNCNNKKIRFLAPKGSTLNIFSLGLFRAAGSKTSAVHN